MSVAPLGIVQPRSVAEVVALVRQARTDKRPLYPVSRGMNWGYGGTAPVRPGCTLVDLSAMDRVRNADVLSIDRPVALIEPGVTQRQLHELLQRQAPGLTFNVTGSAASSSLIGNALDRGVGYLGPRIDDLFALEVVLGTGDVITTGFRRLGEDSPLAHAHRHGLGPVPDGLFFQGSFGIVTSACFRLLRRRPVERALSIGLRDAERLGVLLDRLVALKRDGLLASVAHVGNAERTRATLHAGIASYLRGRGGLDGAALAQEVEAALRLIAGTPWTGLAGLAGSAAQVRAALSEVRGRLRGVATVRTFDAAWLARGAAWADRLRALPAARRAAAALSAALPLQALALGTPTDVAFDNLLQLHDEVPPAPAEYERSRCGVLFVSPALPADGAFVQAFVAEMRATAAAHGHPLYITVNVETEHAVVGVVNLLYDRARPGEEARARACAHALHTLIQSRGLEVYRARSDQMPAVTARQPAHWALLQRLKQAWDPDDIIAPGRYAA